MSIDLKFKQKFYGIVYAQLDRNSACKVSGNGEETAKIQIPLKGCGTEQVDPEVATTGTPNAPSARNNTTNIPAHMILEWINRIIVSQDGVFNAAL